MLTVNGTNVLTHQLKGPVEYTEVGSPALADGIVTDCYYRYQDANNRWIRLENALPERFSSFEFVQKIKVNTQPTFSWQTLFSTSQSATAPGTVNIMLLRANPVDGTLVFSPNFTYAEPNQILQTKLSLDTWYWVKITQVGDVYTMSVSTDGRTYTPVSTATSAVRPAPGFYAYYGVSGVHANVVLTGLVDMANSYIKIDGKLWFYQPQETKRIVVNGVEVWRKAQ